MLPDSHRGCEEHRSGTRQARERDFAVALRQSWLSIESVANDAGRDLEVCFEVRRKLDKATSEEEGIGR